MYNFIMGQWKLGKYDEAKVRSYVPKYITAEQADTIIATPQTGTVLSSPNTDA